SEASTTPPGWRLRSRFTGCEAGTTDTTFTVARIGLPRLPGGSGPPCAAPTKPLYRSPMAENGTTARNVGKVIEIKGVVIDEIFPDRLPHIYSALQIDMPAREIEEARILIAEVQQHLGDDRVRAVAMDTTDGL